LKANEETAGIGFAPGNITSRSAGAPPKQLFDNISLTWKDAASLRALAKLLEKLAERG
jgi:hypothetical protein